MTHNSYRILLADDDSDDRYILHQSFEEIGWDGQVKLFESGKQLILYLDNLNSSDFPKLIVLDFNMPGMNAAEIIHHLKKHDKYKDIAVAVYSTDMSPQMEQRLLSMGVVTCFQKVFRIQDVINQIKSFIRFTEETLDIAN